MSSFYGPAERIDPVLLTCDLCSATQTLRIVGRNVLCQAHSKVCSKCDETKPLDAFHRDASRADGRFPQCKACRKPYAAKYQPRQREVDRQRRQELWEDPKECQIEGCEKPTIDRYCSMHATRVYRHGDVDVVKQPTYRRGPDHHHHAGDQVRYFGAHLRVRRLRGAASSHACLGCGSQAQQWAYDHTDHEERHQVFGNSRLPYSPDPEHYLPLCTKCHKVFDLFVLAGGSSGASGSPFAAWRVQQQQAGTAPTPILEPAP